MPKGRGLAANQFDYPSKATGFSFRNGNLLLVAMDECRDFPGAVVISAQLDKSKGLYIGQFVTDAASATS